MWSLISLLLLPLLSLWPTAGDYTLEILHIGDVRGHFDEVRIDGGICHASMKKKKQCIGGMARVGTIVKQFRERAKGNSSTPVLFLINGNVMTGTAWSFINGVNISCDVINALRPDAVSLGHHEFDYGSKGLKQYVAGLKVPVTICNLDMSRRPDRLPLPQYHVIDLPTGVKVAIIGHITREASFFTFIDDFVIADELTVVREVVEDLFEKNMEFIVVMSSAGMAIDERIARSIDHVDLIITGFTNSLMYNGQPPGGLPAFEAYPFMIENAVRPGRRVAIVGAGDMGRFIGHVTIRINSRGDLVSATGNPIFLDRSIEEDAEVLAALASYRQNVEAKQYGKAGLSTVLLEGPGDCRIRECNLGNMLTDAFVEYTASVALPGSWSTAPVGLMHAAVIRVGLDQRPLGGSLVFGDLVDIAPFPGGVSAVSMRGRTLLAMFEHSVSTRTHPPASLRMFLQVSGVRITFNCSRPPGSRVVSLELRCGKCRVPQYSPLVYDAVYNVVLPAFLLRTDEGWFRRVLTGQVFDVRPIKPFYAEILDWYVKKNTPVHPEFYGRIVFLDPLPGGCHRKALSGRLMFLWTLLLLSLIYSQ